MIDNITYLFVVLSLYGNILIIRKNYNGFLLWIITNLLWAAYDWHKEIYSQSILFLVYTGFAVYGYMEWRYSSYLSFWKFMLGGYIRSILK